jgi:uncharacterized membrane protein YeiH
MSNWIFALDIIGTVVFAISGWLTASKKELDYFGGIIIAIVTAVGGGSIRDMVLGNTPVGWVKNETTILAIFAGIVIAILFHKWLDKLRRTLFLFDTLGIAVFTVSGTQLALNYDILPVPAVLLGIASAVAGGIIRDTLCNEIPLVFRKEIYATACLLGAVVFYASLQMGLDVVWSTILSCIATVSLRTIAVWKNIELPKV